MTYFMPNNKRNEKMRARGIYFALAMCLVALAVAGAATYDSVMEALEYGEESSATETSIIPQEDDPEQPREAAGPTSAPDENTEVKEPEKPEPTPAAAESKEESSSQPEESDESSDESSGESSTAEVNTAPEEYEEPSYLFPLTTAEIHSPYSTEPVYSPIMRDYRSHRGVDISAETGDTVRAITAGQVTRTGYDILLGNFVEISHGDIVATYAGLGDTILVQEGEEVTGGMAVGSIYSVPGEENETPHLHLEMKRNGEYIDPMSLFE